MRWGVNRLRVIKVIAMADLHIPDPETTRASQALYLLDLSEGKKVADNLSIRYRPAGSPVVPRLRAASSARRSVMALNEEMYALYPKELLLLTSSSQETALWRDHLTRARTEQEQGPAKRQKRNVCQFYYTRSQILML